jgi:CrcB protein
MNALFQCLTVGAAGFAGAVVRYGLNVAAAAVVPGRPWLGTLAINLSGSFALGYFLSAFGERLGPAHPARLAVAVGFLGAYTTFSTFTFEADAMLRRGETVTFAAYVGGSVALGLLACAAGVAAGR